MCQSSKVTLLWWNIAVLPRPLQFVLLASAVLAFHITQGYTQELFFQKSGARKFYNFFTLVQFIYFCVIAYCDRKFLCKSEKRLVPLKQYAFIGLLTILTVGLSNAAVAHLNYPTHLMFKCCKLIPVMIGSILIVGRRYNVADVISCFLMTVGLIFFTKADSVVQPTFHFDGVVYVSLALFVDSMIGNFQEKILVKYGSSNVEMVLYSYGFGFVYMFIMLLFSGNFIEALSFWNKNPSETYLCTLIFSLCGYFGLNVILSLIKNFGALLTVTVTTLRKSITIVVSFLFFPKPFTFQYVWSGFLVFCGVILNVLDKNRQLWNPLKKLELMMKQLIVNGSDIFFARKSKFVFEV